MRIMRAYLVGLLVTIACAVAFAQTTGNNGLSGGGVTKITAGTNVTISPVGGTGNVTVNASGGGSSAFNAITSGTNTSAAMVLGTGSSFSTTGTVVPLMAPTMTTAATTQDGIFLQNTTAAATGAQQYSPSLHLEGQGWKTTATAASEAVDWLMYVVPVQGAANPTSTLDLCSSFNGGAYTCSYTFNTGGIAGELTVGSIGVSGSSAPSYGMINSSSGCTGIDAYNGSAGTLAATFCETSGATGVFAKVPVISSGTTFAFSSGTGACATTSTLVGGQQAGHLTCTGSTGASTVTLTLAATTNSYTCWGRDITTPTTVTQTGAVSTTAVTLTLTSVTASDVVEFGCLGY
jgi:hypothetical protein